MKRGCWFLFLSLASFAAILLDEGAVDAARVLKERNIVTAQADKNECDHHNLLNGDPTMGDILKNKLPSGPSGGVGHKNIDPLGPVKMKTSNAGNTLKINKLPSGPSGVGNKYINADGSMKQSVVRAQPLITTTLFNKLPSGPSGGVGHSNND